MTKTCLLPQSVFGFRVLTFALVCLLAVALASTPAAAQIPTLSINPDQTCYQPGDLVVVTVDMSESAEPICGAQVFLRYDSAKLDFISAVASGQGPFTFQIFEEVDQEQGFITYAVAQIPTCSNATLGPVSIVVITFEATGTCFPFVEFRPHNPPTLLSGVGGTVVEPILVDMEPVKIDDGTVPVVVCPDTIVVCAAADTLLGVANWAPLTDGCVWPVDATCDAEPGATFPIGTSVVNCEATEFCGLTDQCSFDVIVLEPIPEGDPGDSNGDLNVDLVDYVDFDNCFGGPGLPPTPDTTLCVEACLTAFDADTDGDIDLLDFGAFQSLFTGP